MLRHTVFLALVAVLAAIPAMAEDTAITPGQSSDDASKLMQDAGFKEAGLDMAPTAKDTSLKMWSVGDGVLIFTYSTKDKKVTALSFFLCDERPKASRREFEFSVTEFDPKTKAMKIKIQKQDADRK